MFEHGAHAGRSFYAGLLEALTGIMGSAKGYLSDHAPRVAYLSRQLARRLGMDEQATSELVFAAVLADIGMVGLAEDAWENPKPVLDRATRERVESHPIRSEAMVAAVPHLEGVAELVRSHHEWWSGEGYPDGLRRDAIPVGARILRLADTVCALGAPRPQRPPLSHGDVVQIVRESRGGELAPDVVDAYLELESAGRLTDFDEATHRRSLRKAAEHLLPAEVSPLSSDHLLDLLASIIDAKDPYTGGHSRRVAILAVAVAGQLGLDDRFRTLVWAAGYLHDLGKLTVPLSVLAKESALADDEYRTVQGHARRGADILQTIDGLRHLATGARYHHERWDGRGYPERLSGENIPMVARILAVCDAYDAMTSTRAYRDARDHDEAMEEVALCTGRHFGPSVGAAFLSLPDHLFRAVRRPPSSTGDFFPQDALLQRSTGSWRLRRPAG